jgi:hypothetical protein
MTDDEKKKFVNTTGIIMLNIAEGKAVYQMADELKMNAQYVEHDIDEMLYVLRKGLGWRRYLKALFIK